MERSRDSGAPTATAKAQRVRLNLVLRGCVAFACNTAIVAGCWALGFLDGDRALHYALAVTVINGIAVLLIVSNVNLRFRDPSMAIPLVLASLAAAAYVMYHVTEPMIRAAFLLMGSVVILFGALALSHRRMQALGAVTLVSYVSLLILLQRYAPERIDLRVEIVMVLAFALVLGQIVSLGSLVGGLRSRLKDRNAALVKAMAELEDLATRDPLTRLPNRRSAMNQLERELSRAERRRREGDGLCIGLLDVDHFKRVNDRLGHQAGDAVLRQIGQALNDTMRQGDFVARFGGEEFLIILPSTSLEGAIAAADRMREAIATMPLESLPVPMPAPVTVSIGLATHQPGRRIEETIGFADNALYRAKSQGRDRVVVWDHADAGDQLAGG